MNKLLKHIHHTLLGSVIVISQWNYLFFSQENEILVGLEDCGTQITNWKQLGSNTQRRTSINVTVIVNYLGLLLLL